jgi:hypothetical protein
MPEVSDGGATYLLRLRRAAPAGSTTTPAPPGWRWSLNPRFSYLFISHDLAVARHMSDEVLVPCQGEVVEQGPAEEVYARPRHPYTLRLLESVPGRGRGGARP